MLSVSVKKLKSNNGASISISLLLFLVCAVIGAVVLTAATASSGRFSNLEKSDRRYYSVTSAVKLLKDVIEEEEIKVILTKNETTGATTEVYSETTLLGKIASDGVKSCGDDFDSKYDLSGANYSTTESKSLTLKVSGKDSLNADVTVSSNSSCTLTITVSSGDAGEKYTQTLIFTPQIDSTESTQKDLTSTIKTKTIKFSWTLTEIR